MFALALAVTVVLSGDPNDWNEYGKKPAKSASAKGGAGAAAPPSSTPPGVPAAAKARYQDAVSKLAAKQYGPANDMLNALAGEFPRVAEIFASRCSAQLGLKHWAAAEADCDYALKLKQVPTAVYGLAVAEDGQGKYNQAVGHYRQYAALADATAALKQQALSRADLLGGQVPGAAPAPAPAPAPAKVTPVVAEAPLSAPPVAASAPPPGGAKGEFVPGIPDPGEGLVYVYRNILMGVGTKASLWVDNTLIGELWNDRYYELKLRSGNHTITIRAAVGSADRTPPEHAVQLEVAEGSVSYLKLEYWPKADDVGFKLQSIGKAGRKEIRSDCELVASRKL